MEQKEGTSTIILVFGGRWGKKKSKGGRGKLKAYSATKQKHLKKINKEFHGKMSKKGKITYLKIICYIFALYFKTMDYNRKVLKYKTFKNIFATSFSFKVLALNFIISLIK